MQLDQIAQSLLEKLRELAQTETVVGQPIQSGDVTLVPVSRVSLGFGMGGQEKQSIGGGGGGATIEPVAFLWMKGDDVRILPVHQNSSPLHKVVDLVPELLQTFRKDK
jgi:uncharacterized spore protein YtfJ